MPQNMRGFYMLTNRLNTIQEVASCAFSKNESKLNTVGQKKMPKKEKRKEIISIY